jgi:oligopeptidase B
MTETKEVLKPPVAQRRRELLEIHDDSRVDDWYWLRNREDPEVISYLEAENAYQEAMTAHTAELRDRLFEEIKSRIQETDLSAPTAWAGWWYYTRTVEGQQYAIHCRSRTEPPPDGSAPDEQVTIDENALAEGHEFFALRAYALSPDHNLVAYSTNYDGSDLDDIHVRDLRTGEDLPDLIPQITSNVVWASDNRTLFYVQRDAALRPYQLWRHALSSPVDQDVLVFQEDDEKFRLHVGRSKSDRFLILGLSSTMTDEYHVLEADDPTGEFRVVEARRPGVEYSVTHHGDRLLIVTNDDGAENFKLVQAPVDAPGRANWTEFLPYDPDVRLYGVDEFAGHLALFERANALLRLRVVRLDDLKVHEIEQPETVYTAGPGWNPEFETGTLRYGYTSLVTPSSVYDYDMNARTRTLRKRQPVLGGYEPSGYETVREWATASDGTAVPMSIVFKKGTPLDGSAPGLIYGYGSYEASMDPSFNSLRLSLLDRGFVYAVAHIRGGGEMGRAWYENGKFLHKRNTFTDFVACAEHLIARRYTSADRLVANGGSAGGLLMGAVVNLRPDLFRAVVAQVPFVDVVTTMLDETIPLTVGEFEEWGNPKDAGYYSYMKSYSPYDNVEPKDYPTMLVTTGLNDTRVAFWEPAKWVAKLRVTKTDDNRLLLKTEMGAGHSGPSGRYNAWKEVAYVYAFILDALGMAA